MLLVIGAILTASPVVYQTVEKLEFIKVAAVLVFIVVALLAAIKVTAFEDTSNVVTSFGTFPKEIELAILVGALAAAGAGGANNLVQSNWIRDKGFGMGSYVPRIVSPITGHEEAAPGAERLSFPLDEQNLSRWKTWWKRANLEQFVSFACIAALTIVVFSWLAYSTVYKNPDLPDSSGFDFIALEASVLDGVVGDWFGTMFLAVGAISLFAAALGIVDYVSRLVADVIHTGYVRGSKRWSESKLYFAVVWSMITFGCLILLVGFDQPLVLLTISTVMGGAIMTVYTSLLLITNRRYLPEPDPARRLPARDPVRLGGAARHLHGDRRRQRGEQAVLILSHGAEGRNRADRRVPRRGRSADRRRGDAAVSSPLDARDDLDDGDGGGLAGQR